VKVAVKDANVLIDLEVSELFDLWFQLGYETYVPDLVIAELKDGKHHQAISYAEAGQLRVFVSPSEFLLRATLLNQQVGGSVGIVDCSALLLAKDLGAMLLSGDGALRRVADHHQVEVHGSIWIFDELIRANLLSPVVAAGKLELLLRSDRRLPREICRARIAKWRI